MKIVPTAIEDVLILEPDVFQDHRGFFFESFNERKFEELTGKPVRFVQDNHSRSRRNVLRGMHYQIQHSQAKLLRVVSGEIYDVTIDLRKSSPTFGRWVGVHVSAQNFRQLFVPEGFGHGFVVLSEEAEILYKVTDFHYPEYERTLIWNDKDVGVNWPLQGEPLISEKDSKGVGLTQAETFI